MTVTAPRRGLRALFEEARRRAGRRRAGYAAVALAVVVSATGYVVLEPFEGGHAGEPKPRPAPPVESGELALERAPYLGVTCDGRPNWIGCDRVGLAVALESPAQRLEATINGRAVEMLLLCGNNEFPGDCASYCRAASSPCGTAFQGFLRPAGLLDGPLKVRPDRGRYRWFGYSEAPVAVVRLKARFRDGEVARTSVRVRLAAGYG